MKLKKQTVIIIAIVIVVALAAATAYMLFGQNTSTNIRSYQDCVAKGYPVQESYPSVCKVPGSNQSFSNPTEQAPKP